MSSIGANYAQLQVMQKKQKEKMMKKRLEKERDGSADGVSSASTGKSEISRLLRFSSKKQTNAELIVLLPPLSSHISHLRGVDVLTIFSG
ncbi:unnamed protein product [Microthlaspi erraticum]|uniref:Uncharacterized protein n=1 Tax=Microthlaspi erraticum TaxID=1685480 RepID=A0A6D2KAP6_9BRAS|nr:unnamed protein product [Microthlaspi erraticum]